VGILDKFKSKSSIATDDTQVEAEFTDEENAAIAAMLDDTASRWAARHNGEGYLIPVKANHGTMAVALAEYAADLLAQCDDCGFAERSKKAIHAQKNAYALHNLPIYIFQLAGMYEIAGDAASAKYFLKHFLRE
jgi:hypothetical protein